MLSLFLWSLRQLCKFHREMLKFLQKVIRQQFQPSAPGGFLLITVLCISQATRMRVLHMNNILSDSGEQKCIDWPALFLKNWHCYLERIKLRQNSRRLEGLEQWVHTPAWCGYLKLGIKYCGKGHAVANV